MTRPAQPAPATEGAGPTRRTGLRRLFDVVAVAEACSWAALLVAMYLKRVAHHPSGATAVTVCGSVHGALFVTFCLLVAYFLVRRRWSFATAVVGAISSVVPFMTLWFDRWVRTRELPAS